MECWPRTQAVDLLFDAIFSVDLELIMIYAPLARDGRQRRSDETVKRVLGQKMQVGVVSCKRRPLHETFYLFASSG